MEINSRQVVSFQPGTVQSDHTRVVLPGPHPPQAKALNQDSFHISVNGKTNGRPAAQISFFNDRPSPQTELSTAVHVDKKIPKDQQNRLLGFLSMTPNQEQQISAAESRAFERFNNAGWDRDRGSLSAKIRQSQMQTFQPGLVELGSSGQHISDGEKKQVMDALKDYAEDLGAISLTGRNKKGLQTFLEDKFFITLFDRDKDEFEDYFKGGMGDFFGDRFGENDPNNALVNPSVSSSSENLIDLPDQKPESQYQWKFFRPRVSVSMSGLDFQKAKIKPKIDLLRMRGPANTEIRLETELPYQLNGTFEPEAQLSARRIFNYKPGEYGELKDNVLAEARAGYNYSENQVSTTIGLRKQLSPDTSAGVYGLYRQSFDNGLNNDAAIGINYQSRFD